MNIKHSYRYQLAECKRSLITFYAVIVFLLLVLFVASLGMTQSGADHAEFGGMNGASVIFLFVIGLCTVRETLGMLLQNGVSRKTMFWGKLGVMATLSLGMAILDELLVMLGNVTSSLVSDRLECAGGLFQQVYSSRLETIGGIQCIAEGMLFDMMLYLGVFALGFFLGAAYYRMGKHTKLAISIGVPAFLFLVFPLVDNVLFEGAVFRWLGSAFDFCMGLSRQTPYPAMLSGLVTCLVFTFLAWLLMRRAPLKS